MQNVKAVSSSFSAMQFRTRVKKSNCCFATECPYLQTREACFDAERVKHFIEVEKDRLLYFRRRGMTHL